MRVGYRLLVIAAVFWVVLSLAPGPATGAGKWDPIDPKELAATTPTVEKDADAEVLLWDIRIADEFEGRDVRTVFSHYLRVKIYTDRGREAQSRVDIERAGSVRVRDVEGRSVRRDGTFAELKKDDVFDRSLVKAGRLKVKATSFVLPAVETGGIVEYRWREVHDDSISQNMRLPFSRDIPVQLVRYHIAPLDLHETSIGMRGMPFHCTPTPLVVEGRGFETTSLSNVPAYHDESSAPPEWELRPWMLIYYDYRATSRVPAEFWGDFSRRIAAEQRKGMAPTAEIQRAVASLPLGGASLDQKIAALTAFCRSKIKRVDVDSATDAERKAFKGNKSPTAALAAGRGTGLDVVGLFIAMARAAGLDARMARLPRRDDVVFDPEWMLTQFMADVVVAIRDGDDWRFVDPSNEYAPQGHLTWVQEMEPALVGDERAIITATTPVSPPEWSIRSRTATLRLSEDGTLEGDVTTEYTGHLAMALKEENDHLAPAERETALKDELTERLPGIEMTEVRVDNVTDPDKPYITRMHVKVPGYAQRTGSRLFVQPAVFQKGIPPVFPEAGRRHPIYFDHAWKEIDRVRIDVPPGYELESLNAPAPLTYGALCGHSLKLTQTASGSQVEMTREFFFGGGLHLQFPSTSYRPLKQFFDEVARADARTITLRKSTGGRP